MKNTILLAMSCVVLTLAAGSVAAAGLADTYTPSSVSYVSQGRYLIFQGSYVNDQGAPESGLIKFDSQTGMAWMLRAAPRTNDAPPEFNWAPVKN